MSNKVYFAHEDTGRMEKQIILSKRKMKYFDRGNNFEFISPLHTLERHYQNVLYSEIINKRFEMMIMCDEIWFPDDIFDVNNPTMLIEYGYARAKDKKIVFYDNRVGERR